MAVAQLRNIHQFLEGFYGHGINSVAKINAPILSSTDGVFNAVFGAQAFSQLNNEANVFGLLPKRPWEKSGWRVITSDAGSTADGGITENGTIPDTIKQDFFEVQATVKQVVHTFDVSYVHEGLVAAGDDALGDLAFQRGAFAVLHAKRINEQLCVDANTLAGDNFESIDRVTFSAAAQSALSYTAGDDDIYNINRGNNSWADAVVDHNSGTDRFIDDTLIRDTLATLKNNGARTNLIITGNDTLFKIFGLYENQVRYRGVLSKSEMVQVGINGVTTEEGINGGVRVATVYGIPVFSSQAIKKDTISRIYLLDTTDSEETGIPRLFMALMYPTLYFEAGMSAANPNPFPINRLGTQGMYYTAGELICTFFKVQASIRDLK